MKGFRVLGDPLFSRGLTSRLRIGTRMTAGGISDTTRPTCTITCAQSSPSAATTLNFTITFKNGVGGENEEVTGFNISKFAITNGTKSNFAGSGAVYTCDVTPTGMSVVTANVAADVAQDAAGNLNTAADQLSITSTAPFTDNFTRADGAIGSIWTGATWSISGNQVLNTPTVGNELLTNPGFEGTYDDESGGGGGTVNVAPNWNKLNVETDGTDTLNESATAHGGNKSQLINVNSGSEGITCGDTAAAGWYQLSAYANITSGGAVIANAFPYYIQAQSTVTGSWVQIATSGLVAATSGAFVYSINASNFLIDDASRKLISLPTLFATLPSVGLTDVTAWAVLPVSPATTFHQSGLILNLDSTSNPLNFVVAFLVRLEGATEAKLYKCVNGTYTQVITGNVTHNAAHSLKVVKSGNNYSLYYGATGSETQVGTTQAIAGMTGTIHGIIGSHPTAKLDNFTLAATP